MFANSCEHRRCDGPACHARGQTAKSPSSIIRSCTRCGWATELLRAQWQELGGKFALASAARGQQQRPRKLRKAPRLSVNEPLQAAACIGRFQQVRSFSLVYSSRGLYSCGFGATRPAPDLCERVLVATFVQVRALWFQFGPNNGRPPPFGFRRWTLGAELVAKWGLLAWICATTSPAGTGRQDGSRCGTPGTVLFDLFGYRLDRH